MCSNIRSSSRTYTFLVKFSVSHGPLYSVARATPDEYVNFLNRGTPETAEELTHGGLLSPRQPTIRRSLREFEYRSVSPGGSIAAAQRLSGAQDNIAINWAGLAAAPLVNDIVLSILAPAYPPARAIRRNRHLPRGRVLHD
ncbi:hypothetical protein C8F01DRAFT_1265433 [Mycena amicta]|nr:hypothetical protein C8F01DRAFT_1265433 [Mycena amicta]